MRLKICPICVSVTGIWLVFTALVLTGYLPSKTFLPLIALLMGGSVVGIAYQFAKRRALIIGSGMLLAFLAVRNLSFKVFGLEILAMAALAYLLFREKNGGANSGKSKARELLEEKLKQCC